MRTPPKVRQEGGAAAVEFAIIAPLLFVLIFGMLQYGLAFFQVQDLRAAAREGARVAAVRGTTQDVAAAMIAASAGSLPLGWSPPTFAPCTDTTSGTPVTVTIDPYSLPQPVQGSLVVSVPFLPSIDLRPNLDISGSFRCE